MAARSLVHLGDPVEACPEGSTDGDIFQFGGQMAIEFSCGLVAFENRPENPAAATVPWCIGKPGSSTTFRPRSAGRPRRRTGPPDKPRASRCRCRTPSNTPHIPPPRRRVRQSLSQMPAGRQIHRGETPRQKIAIPGRHQIHSGRAPCGRWLRHLRAGPVEQ